MDFIPFYTRYADVAAKETRTMTVISSDFGIPPGEYGLIENYCSDKSCDCRKVMINVVDAASPQEFLATIGYGWESAAFYTRWIGGNARLGKMMVGAYLEPGCVQTAYSPQFLELFKTAALTDNYVERIKRHYRMFKDYERSASPRTFKDFGRPTPPRRKKRKRAGQR